MKLDRDNYCTTHVGLAEGTNANTFQLARAVGAVINGVAVHKAVTDNIAFSGGHTAQAALTKAAYFVMMDASGTISTIQAGLGPKPGVQSYVPRAVEWPNVTDKACLGAIVVQTDNAATFTAGATDLGAADVIDTYHHRMFEYGVPITL